MARPPYYLTAYALAVKHGFKGTEEEWLESLHGAGGARGPEGPQGPQGPQGTPGEPGTLIIHTQGNEAELAPVGVLAAVEKGQNVVLLYGDLRLTLVHADENSAVFTAVAGGQMTAKVVMDADGWLSPQTFQLASKDDVKVVQVNLTATEEEGVYTADRSYEEVVAAIDAGRTVIVVHDGIYHNYLLEDSGDITFTANVADYMSVVYISPDIVVADIYPFAMADQIPTKVSQLENDSGYLPGQIQGKEVMIAPISTVTGKIPWNENVTGGVEHAQGIYSIFDIEGKPSIIITGYQWQSQYNNYSHVFYDANGATISKHLGAADDTGFVDLEVAVPENAKTIRINGKTPLYTPVVKYLESVDVAEVIKDVVNAQKAPKAPKAIFMGDSITALGLQPQGWVKYFLEATGCELVANTAVIGATLKDKDGTAYDGNPVFNGEDANVNNVLGNQVQKIINNGYEAPDIIMIAIGTNDGISITTEQMRAVYYGDDGSLIALDQVDRTTAAGAYRYCLDTLHALYPDAVICWCTPIHAHEQIRTAAHVMAWAESLRIATEFTGQILIDTIRCGISGINEANNANGEYLMDGLHPNMNGAKKIGYYNASKVLPLITGMHVKG